MFKFMLHYLLKKFVSKSAIVVVALLSGVPVTFPSQNGYKTIKVLLFGESVFHEVWVTAPLPETAKDTRLTRTAMVIGLGGRNALTFL